MSDKTLSQDDPRRQFGPRGHPYTRAEMIQDMAELGFRYDPEHPLLFVKATLH
jgi:hypothetical protein